MICKDFHKKRINSITIKETKGEKRVKKIVSKESDNDFILVFGVESRVIAIKLNMNLKAVSQLLDNAFMRLFALIFIQKIHDF